MKRAEVPDGSREYNQICKFRAWENICMTAWIKLLLLFATETEYEKNLLKNYIMSPSLPKLPSIHMIGYGHYMGITINIIIKIQKKVKWDVQQLNYIEVEFQKQNTFFSLIL